MQNTTPTESKEGIIANLEKHLPKSSTSFPDFVLFSYVAHMMIKETEKMLNDNLEGGAELDMEKLKLYVLRTRQSLDKVVPELKQFNYPTME